MHLKSSLLNELHHEKTCLQGLRPVKTESGLLSFRDWLETWNLYLASILSKQQTTKALIKLHRCAGWSASLLFAYSINRFSHVTWLKYISTSLQHFSLQHGFGYNRAQGWTLWVSYSYINHTSHDMTKHVFRSFRARKAQTSLCSHRS